MLSMLQQGILARAKEIVDEKDYNLLCKRANICPICGSGLIEDRTKRDEKRRPRKSVNEFAFKNFLSDPAFSIT